MVAGGNGLRPVTQQRRSEYLSLADPLNTGDLTEISSGQSADIALTLIGILLNFLDEGEKKTFSKQTGDKFKIRYPPCDWNLLRRA